MVKNRRSDTTVPFFSPPSLSLSCDNAQWVKGNVFKSNSKQRTQMCASVWYPSQTLLWRNNQWVLWQKSRTGRVWRRWWWEGSERRRVWACDVVWRGGAAGDESLRICWQTVMLETREGTKREGNWLVFLNIFLSLSISHYHCFPKWWYGCFQGNLFHGSGEGLARFLVYQKE